ncbi:MAG: glycosyltransferase family 2 protein [Candidatus Accumulibacter sp.]|jgi:predicted LPLAT superfamily acyltransferase|nr:glycosyltransferase family 2 protein [Accumulibacter sp.]
MSFSPCLLIPIYNHGGTIRAAVERLASLDLPIFVVDDGSDEATQAALDALAADFPRVRLFRLPRNEGKGAAVMRGLREARRAGFSHALQIDADGQHDAADAPRFLALGAAHPEALVCGRPVFDASAPKARLRGRRVTHFWVGVETLNPRPPDSLCGYRLYPLAAACALLERAEIARRMDFDIEILVRLVWEGVETIELPTRVVYPDGGVSHFDMRRDNLRISMTHARLFGGMLLRLPRLLWRKCFGSARAGAHWSALAERGGALGLKILFACHRRLGRRAAGWLLYPVVGYFFLTGSRARAASLAYLRRVHRRLGRAAPSWRDSFRHMLAFGRAALDKLAAWLGEIDERGVDFPARAEFDRALAAGRGAVLIGAHLGNLEMARALAATSRRAAVNAIVYTDHARRFNEMLRRANADFGVNLIQVSSLGPETAIMLKEKIERGELVVIVGDRTPPAASGAARTCRVDFLGEPAPFAQGPFILAGLLGCPVYLFFCLREGERHRIYLEPFAERIELPRRERPARLLDYLRRYAGRLEHHCLRAPEQWFNFYDFWRPAPAGPEEGA